MKSRKQKPEDSPAVQIVRLVVQHEGTGQGKSWDRTNHASLDAIDLAIKYGIPFAPDDFKVLSKHIYYSGAVEMIYALACGSERGRENKSAAIAFEKWTGRKPFLIRQEPNVKSPSRVYVGCEFYWYGERVKVTSFKDPKSEDESGSFTACTYKATENEYERKIDRRITITHDMIREYHQAIIENEKLRERARPLSKEMSAKMNAWLHSEFPKVKPVLTLDQAKAVNAKLDEIIPESQQQPEKVSA